MTDHGNVEEIRHHGHKRVCQEIGFAEPARMLGEKRFFLEARQCLGEDDRNSGVEALPERFNCPSLEDEKGGNASQAACPYQCKRKDQIGRAHV